MMTLEEREAKARAVIDAFLQDGDSMVKDIDGFPVSRIRALVDFDQEAAFKLLVTWLGYLVANKVVIPFAEAMPLSKEIH